VRKYKQYRDAAEFARDAGFTTDGALAESGMSRRSFLGRIGRWSTALAVFGLGPEAWMRVASRGSIVSSAVAAEATRDRRLHPFPSDDPYNMPLGTNVWYAPIGDPATDTVRTRSIIPAEEGQWEVFERCPIDAVPAIPVFTSETGDRHMHVIYGDYVLENFRLFREGDTVSRSLKPVRNQLSRYSFGRGTRTASNPLTNRASTRAWCGSALAGLIRKHDIEKREPHIPHALCFDADTWNIIAGSGQGDPTSPLYNVDFMFPAACHDYGSGSYPSIISGKPVTESASARMGMRFALDPTICTDAWINANAPNIHHRAVARAMRDYGIILGDASRGGGISIAADQNISEAVADNLHNWNGSPKGIGWLTPYLRRVAGRLPDGTIVHNPLESHWDTWRKAGQGWGGGSPRVPYSPPLAPAFRRRSAAGDASRSTGRHQRHRSPDL
jgi:hypothetical protein